MAGGVNENVEVFGRVFHVQTEVSPGAKRVVRSRVFLEGSVVAARESPVDPRETSEERLRNQVKNQHSQIIGNLIERDIELETQESSGDLGDQSSLIAEPPAIPTPREISLPGLENDPALHSSVKARRLIGPFSLALRPSPDHDPSAVCGRLDRAADMVKMIMDSAIFPDIRLDEQVRFVDLKERLGSWRGGGRDPDVASQILLQMVVFAGHLRRINDRRDLIALDHTLLTWALFAVGPPGTADDVLPYLHPLYGRDADLDQMLDNPDETDVEALCGVLQDLLERTQPAE
jgi:hypothetical protein